MLPQVDDAILQARGQLASQTEPQPPISKRSAQALLDGLRDVLRQNLASTDLSKAARRLGTSPRSLQRSLTALGTSFRKELGSARIQRAQQRLQSETVALTTIALELGYGSLQSFDRHFRRLTGVTPGGFRRQSRRDQPG